MTSALRSFLRYQVSELHPIDLAACVPCVADWSSASIPKGLPIEHVKRVLASAIGRVHRPTRTTRFLLLLHVLGCDRQVAAPHAGADFDWETGGITLPRQTVTDTLSFPTSRCRKAIAAYLKDGRTRSTNRCVFLLHKRGRRP